MIHCAANLLVHVDKRHEVYFVARYLYKSDCSKHEKKNCFSKEQTCHLTTQLTLNSIICSKFWSSVMLVLGELVSFWALVDVFVRFDSEKPPFCNDFLKIISPPITSRRSVLVGSSFFFTLAHPLLLDFQIRTIPVDAKRCKLQVWDTAGQDRFKCVVTSFYRGSHGVMICFDITDLDSFRNVENWFEEVKRYCPEQTPVILVGTKADLQAKRMVPYSTIKAYIEKRNISYIETSSKTNENIEKSFDDLSRTLVAHVDRLGSIQKKQPVDSSNDGVIRPRKPVQTPGGGCFGSDKCTIWTSSDCTDVISLLFQ